MPNVGTVDVEQTANMTAASSSNANTSSWEVTFTSAVGAFPALEVR